jgi:cyclohexanone monooxygenase
MTTLLTGGANATGVRHHRVIIVGAGFSGIGMAIRLRQTGERDFIVLEREAGVGGTWRVNNYPGCACDVPSHLYSFSFAPNPTWTRMFAPQPEIRSYIETCCERFGLAPHLQFNTTIASMTWDAGAARWQVLATDGQAWTCDALVLAVGGLSTPSYPSIAGLETFAGKTFHSQQWDHSYDLVGKRIAVIGTGASAIQFVPQIQPQVAQLDVYQRTPPWILPKPDRAITGREQRWFSKVPMLQQLYRGWIYSQLEARATFFVKAPAVMKLAGQLARNHIKRQLSNPTLQAKVTPDYTIGCKRVLISNDYYPALAQPNCELITDDIREVRPHSIVAADGRERAVDAIIFGTGFRATAPIAKGLVAGINGQDLVDAWPNGPEAYKGTTVRGFPNMFILMGPNTGLGHNSMLYMIESQITYVLGALAYLQRAGAHASINVRALEQHAYNQALQNKANRTVWNQGGCQSWYLHPETGRNVTLWPDYTWAFRRMTKQFDANAYQCTTQKGPT